MPKRSARSSPPSLRSGRRIAEQPATTVAGMDMFPLPDDCNIFYLSHVKDVLIRQFGVDEGFKVYREQLTPQKSINHARPQRIQTKQVAKLRDVAAAGGISFTEIHASGEPFVIPPPRQIGGSTGHAATGVTRSSYVACLPNARIHGRSPFLEVDGTTALDYEQRELVTIGDRWNVDQYVFSSDGDVAWKIEFDQRFVDIDEAF